MTVYILPFEKMHGLGNDFVMVEKRHLPNGLNERELAKELCNRNFGIGADGLIIVDFASDRESDFIWSYINADGSYAEMCGNGMRCFAKYVFERGFIDERTFKVSTKAGIIKPTIEDDGTVTVDMGIPKLPSQIRETLNVNSQEVNFTYIETGNPHCIIFLENDVDESFFKQFGPIIEKHKRFPNGTNVEFAHVLNQGEINCRVWERGCGPTLACGTGACATLIAASLNDFTGVKAKVNLPGGSLFVTWDREGSVFLNGPAEFVFTGNYNLNPKHVCVGS